MIVSRTLSHWDPGVFYTVEQGTIVMGGGRNLLFVCHLASVLLRKGKWEGRSQRMPGQGFLVLRI